MVTRGSLPPTALRRPQPVPCQPLASLSTPTLPSPEVTASPVTPSNSSSVAMDLPQLRGGSRRTTRVTVQLLGRRQRLPLPEDVAEGLHEAIAQTVAEHFEVQPPFTFSNDRGLVLEDLELTQAVEAGAIIAGHSVQSCEERCELPRCLATMAGLLATIELCLGPCDAWIKERNLEEVNTSNRCRYGERAVGAGHRCRHGWPQVLVTDPVWPGHRMGDLVRLTCPLLVSAIDRYEKQGAIRGYNERVSDDPAWRQELHQAHLSHRDLRRELLAKVPPEEMAQVRANMGSQTVDLVMETGIASMRFDANCSDVKCLHAQVADELSRGGNAIGRQVLRDLAEAGVEIEGSDQCCDHCNVHLPLSDARWTLNLAKNKLGQRLRRARRREGLPEPPGPAPLPLGKRMPPKNSYLTSRHKDQKDKKAFGLADSLRVVLHAPNGTPAARLHLKIFTEVAHLSDTAMQELSRRVRQLRNLQWGLVNQHLEKTRVEHAMQRLPGESRPEHLLAEQFGELRMELKQTLSMRLERLESSMDERLRALEESWDAKLGALLQEVNVGASREAQDPIQSLQAEIEGLRGRLQTECARMAGSVHELREECCEAIQREVRARLEHHRNLHEEFKEETKTRSQVFGRLEREIQEMKLEMAQDASKGVTRASRTIALPPVRAEMGQVVPYVMEPVTSTSPASPYPASLQSEQLCSPQNPFTILRPLQRAEAQVPSMTKPVMAKPSAAEADVPDEEAEGEAPKPAKPAEAEADEEPEDDEAPPKPAASVRCMAEGSEASEEARAEAEEPAEAPPADAGGSAGSRKRSRPKNKAETENTPKKKGRGKGGKVEDPGARKDRGAETSECRLTMTECSPVLILEHGNSIRGDFTKRRINRHVCARSSSIKILPTCLFRRRPSNV
eukprot:symbB.v1.2.036067.t1/scaffold5008.1/size31855/1